MSWQNEVPLLDITTRHQELMAANPRRQLAIAQKQIDELQQRLMCSATTEQSLRNQIENLRSILTMLGFNIAAIEGAGPGIGVAARALSITVDPYKVFRDPHIQDPVYQNFAVDLAMQILLKPSTSTDRSSQTDLPVGANLSTEKVDNFVDRLGIAKKAVA